MLRNLCLLVTIAVALVLTPPAFAKKGHHHHHHHVAKHYKHAPKAGIATTTGRLGGMVAAA